ncbi:uncharacterized protein Pyn_37616 [Prunus yedoensis var. nudiflora]|uniref:Uncharacterized protein n=1 Tax=Prunus yedoensis var. nudiflora TaxID=2094558 RepID=A0A314Z2F4_PRUYE|nr:uncharacterized protein Pyn_37616 [Prunus yedoensis var. nudiflora]
MEKWAHDVGPRVFAALEKLKKQWDLIEIPCKHACAVIGQLNGNHISYVHDYYKKVAFMKAYKPMVHPMSSQDLWAKTNFPPLLPPKFHKQPGRPKKTRIRSADEPSPSSNPKAKHLPRYHHKGKRRQHIMATHQLGELQDNQGRNKHHLLHNQGKNNQSYQRVKKGTNHHQASSQSNQAPQPSHQQTQASQASQSNQAAQPSHQPTQPYQASQFEHASQAALFEQASQSQEPNSSRPLKASPQRKVRFKSPAKRKGFLAKFKPWRY